MKHTVEELLEIIKQKKNNVSFSVDSDDKKIKEFVKKYNIVSGTKPIDRNMLYRLYCHENEKNLLTLNDFCRKMKLIIKYDKLKYKFYIDLGELNVGKDELNKLVLNFIIKRAKSDAQEKIKKKENS